MSKRGEVKAKLKEVIDPELGVDIVNLGFIYDIEVKEDGLVKVVMTLTTPGCPLAGVIGIMVRDKVRELSWVKKVEVELTFDPPWTTEMMTEEAKLKLNF